MAGSSRSSAPKRPFRERERKKQMRLQFSSLPSSSPGKGNYSTAVQDRLAGVTYEGARSSPRAEDEPSPDPIALLSPEPSSQVQAGSEKTAEMAQSNTFPSSPTRHRVTRIQLSDDEDEDDLISPAQKRRKISNGLPSVPTPQSAPQRRSGRLNHGSSSPLKALALDSSEDGIDELPSSSPRRSSRRLRRRASTEAAQSDESEPPQTKTLPDPTSPNQPSTFSDLGSPETSDDDVVMVTKPTLRRKSRLDADDPFIVNNDELQKVSDRERSSRMPRRKQNRGDDFIVDDDEVEYISSDDEDSSDMARKKSRRRSSTNTTPAKHRHRTQQEQDELEDDIQDLQDSEEETPNTQARTRGGPVTTQKDKAREHLELLKRRRAGERITRIADSDDDFDEEPRGADIELIGEPNYDVSEEGSTASDTEPDVVEPDMEHEENEDDFIEDDMQGRLGRPHADIPLQFTSFASKKPKELFIHILEWMVKNKLAPAFNREDPVYKLAFSRVDDQVTAQAGSRLISSAWVSEFKHTILARPNMKVVALPGLDEEHMRTCDACNRVNNPARYEFVFSGEPYYKKTLEPVDNSDDDEDVEKNDTDDITYDEAGHVIAPEDTCFYLGRFCAANAEMGHKLTHWKYHLNESLMEYLECQGVLSADAIIAREKMNKKKREKEAENIVDSMDETGVIDDFWRNFENDLNDARLGMVDYEKKGGRSKGRVGAIRTKSGGLMREWDKDRYKTVVIPSDSEGE
ncbi:hypothetical protein H2200_012596 [Cladophialophora chaetospira]|uniref:DUF4211 domain-containing protein n=1 Tax=Cladophialophora chaetospira TaxID=386627 RepID=A0AA38WX72_9EURO|nr:hypothetical protein H2200_012596 [Cladophialophora chaetospira]